MNNKILVQFLLMISIISCVKKEDKISSFIKRYDKIVLLSYSEHRDIYRNREELKIENDTIIIPKVKFIDNVTLDNKFSRKIVEVLYSKNKDCSYADCYKPRHIILFYKKNKIVDFYEFCAACGGCRESKNINFPEFCSQKGFKMIFHCLLIYV